MKAIITNIFPIMLTNLISLTSPLIIKAGADNTNMRHIIFIFNHKINLSLASFTDCFQHNFSIANRTNDILLMTPLIVSNANIFVIISKFRFTIFTVNILLWEFHGLLNNSHKISLSYTEI